MMKLLVLAAVLALAFGDVSHLFRRPQQQQYNLPAAPLPVARASSSDQQASILRQSSDIDPEGSYQWAFESDNGIAAQEQGSVRALGPEQVAKSAQGSYSYTSPEGVQIQVNYVADENGYQPDSAALPTPPPVPAAIARALEYIAAHPQPAEPAQQQYRRPGGF